MLGLKNQLDFRGPVLNRIILSRSIALICAIGAGVLLITLTIAFGWPLKSNRWLFLASMGLFSSVLIFHHLKWHNLAKIIVCFAPVLTCFGIAIFNKLAFPDYVVMNDYFTYRIVLIACSIIPILVFGYDEYFKLSLGLSPFILGVVFFDSIHNAFNVGFFQVGFEDESYFMVNAVSIVCQLGLVSFIYILKKQNEVFAFRIIEFSNKMHQKNDLLKELHDEVEIQNKTIKKQNDDLKNFSEDLRHKVIERTKLLTEYNRELIDQNSRLEQFTFITAHNLKSPVTQIKGLLDILGYEDNLNSSTKAILSKVASSNQDLEEVIRDLNKLLELKNGSHIYEKLDVSVIVRSILKSLAESVREKKIEVLEELDEDLSIRSIPAFIHSILYNLIQNAIKYNDVEKDSYIKIFCRKIAGEIQIEVKDNGIGFDRQLVGEKLFQFYQRFNTDIQGKGLGLFLVKTQVDILEGKIEVESKPTIGTTFKISIPTLITETKTLEKIKAPNRLV